MDIPDFSQHQHFTMLVPYTPLIQTDITPGCRWLHPGRLEALQSAPDLAESAEAGVMPQVAQINHDVNRSMKRSASRRSSRTSEAILPGPVLKQSPSLLRWTTSLVKQPVLQKTLSTQHHAVSPEAGGCELCLRACAQASPCSCLKLPVLEGPFL